MTGELEQATRLRAELAELVSHLPPVAFFGGPLEGRYLAAIGDWSLLSAIPLDARNAARFVQVARAVCDELGELAGHGQHFASGYAPTWPAMVIEYRQLWDDYVMGTARAYLAASKLEPPPGSNLTMALWQEQCTTYADDISTSWNMHAGASDAELMLDADGYLRDYQGIVERVGQFYHPMLQKDAPSIPLPSPPTVTQQNAVVRSIENAGIIGHGILQLFAIGVSGALETARQGGKLIGDVVESTTNALPIIAAAVGVAAVAVIVTRR